MSLSANPSVVLVTGSTDGLGRAVAIDLARRGATVLVHGRNQDRIDATRNQIERETGELTARSHDGGKDDQ